MLLAPHNKTLNLLGLRPTGDLGPLTGYTSRRGRPVWFLKAPPTTPPSERQRHQRNTFRLIATLWQSLPPEKRAAWLTAQQLAHLNITGYDLFVWYQQTKDRPTIRTIEHQANLQLLD